MVSVTHEWPSAFMGAIAIPDAINQYTQMYSRLLEKLFADEELPDISSASQQRVQQHVGACFNIFGRGTFCSIVGNAACAGNEDH